MFFDAWRKYRSGELLAGIETVALEVMLAHPEYHALLGEPHRYVDKDYVDELNPFLHMSLHLALEEQLSIDQPRGIVLHFEKIVQRRGGNRHDALHDALECLGETVWRAQREGRPPDADAYLTCLEKRSR